MISEQNIGEWAEKYLQKKLNGEELNLLNANLSANSALKSAWEETLKMMRLMKEKAERNEIRSKIQSLKPASVGAHQERKTIAFSIFRKYGIKTAAAAILVFATALSTYLVMDKKTANSGNQYMVLRREIETIKHSQSKLMDSIKLNSNPKGLPMFGGTGFAVTNDGFVATNYHVVKDATSIYIQTASGENEKAYIVAFEPNSDVALLKIEDTKFRFGKTPLPYSFSNASSGLGQKVYSIGFPQDDLVYNEGYISCETGFQQDTASYQLDITSNPGQSGAPVLDNNGNIIALITGKQSNTSSKTFAVHSGALLQLIHSLPKDVNISLASSNKLRGLDRTQQVNKLRNYVCAVKVN